MLMCVVCQTVSVGAAALMGVLPITAPSNEVPPASQPVATLAGTACKKLGQVRTTSAGRYTCTAAKNRRVWRRTPQRTTNPASNVATRNHPKPTCGPGIAQCPTVSSANPNIDECKIADATPGSVAQGFPRPPRAKAGKAVLEVLVVPVRYANTVIGESEVRAQFEPEFQTARDFLRRNSYGRVGVNFTLETESQWVQVAETWQQFVSARSNDLRRVTQDIVARIPRMNLGAFDSIFIVAAGGTSYWGGMDQNATYTHASGEVHSVYYQTGAAISTNFPHNLGHTAYYLEDLYIHPFFRTSSVTDVTPLQQEVMSNGVDFTLWNRWLAGFLRDEEVHCVSSDTEGSVHRVVHANSDTGKKLVVIPTEPGRAVFAEFGDGGIHVYELNSNIEHGAGPMRTLGFLQIGRSISHANVSITAAAVDAAGVYLAVSYS